jgi:integrase
MTTLIFRTRHDVPPEESPRPAGPAVEPQGPLPLPTDTGAAVAPPTVAGLIDLYCTEYLPHKAPSTQIQYRIVYRSVRADFGELPVPALTPERLRAWRTRLAQRLAPASVRRWMDTLSGVLTVAVRDYAWLESNPLRRVQKPPGPPGRVRFLSDSEQVRLLKACQQSRTPALYPVVLLALTTGARKTEISTLRWRAVDLDRGMIRLEQTKNGERRGVPMPQMTREVLLAWRGETHEDAAWVFPAPRGKGPANFTKAWYGARRRAGLEDFHFHDLRHTAASYLAMSGASLLEIAEILGHKNLQVTKRYSHLLAAHTAGVVERMAQKFVLRDQGETMHGDL